MKTYLKSSILLVLILSLTQTAQVTIQKVFLGSDSNSAQHDLTPAVEDYTGQDSLNEIEKIIEFIFVQLDYTRDGQINYEEFYTASGYFSGYLHLDHPQKELLDALFAASDADQNQYLNKEEFLLALEFILVNQEFAEEDGEIFHFSNPEYDHLTIDDLSESEKETVNSEDFPSAEFLEALVFSQQQDAQNLLRFLTDKALYNFDTNEDGRLGLKDAILALSYTCGYGRFDAASFYDIERALHVSDFNGDQLINTEELYEAFGKILKISLHNKKRPNVHNPVDLFNGQSQASSFAQVQNKEKTEFIFSLGLLISFCAKITISAGTKKLIAFGVAEAGKSIALNALKKATDFGTETFTRVF